MIEFKINNNRKVLAPNKWTELNTEQLLAIEKTEKTDVLGLFAVLTGLDLDIVFNARNKQLEESLFAVVAFIYSPPEWDKLKHGTHLQYKNKIYKVPVEFNKMMLGQKILISQLARDLEKMMENVCQVVAICMQPTIDNSEKYSEKRVDEIAKELLKENGLEVYALAKFFFRNLGGSSHTGKNNFRTFQQQKVRKGKSYQNWLNLTD